MRNHRIGELDVPLPSPAISNPPPSPLHTYHDAVGVQLSIQAVAAR